MSVWVCFLAMHSPVYYVTSSMVKPDRLGKTNKHFEVEI